MSDNPVTPAEVAAIREKVESDLARAQRADMPIFAATTSHVAAILRRLDELESELAAAATAERERIANKIDKRRKQFADDWVLNARVNELAYLVAWLRDDVNHAVEETAADALSRGDLPEPNNSNKPKSQCQTQTPNSPSHD